MKGGQRKYSRKPWDDFSKALGSHTIKSFKGCDFTHLNIWTKAIRRLASEPEKKATKEMKDKQLLKSGFALDGHVERSGIFAWSLPLLFSGRDDIPYWRDGKQHCGTRSEWRSRER